jgi:hypothetical protein
VAQIALDRFLRVALKNLEKQNENPLDNSLSSSSLTSKCDSDESQGDISSSGSELDTIDIGTGPNPNLERERQS